MSTSGVFGRKTYASLHLFRDRNRFRDAALRNGGASLRVRSEMRGGPNGM
jgi:hypothetical protein